jgi:hypothetical protein
LSPHFQSNWRTLIANKEVQQGFGTLSNALIGGGDLAHDFCRLSTT